MNMTNPIKLESVSKKIGKFHVNNISFSAFPKNIVGIIGENGAGKTTLLKIISQTVSLDSGNLSVPPKNEIGFQFDTNHFPEELSAENINLFMPYIFKSWDSKKFKDYLDKFEIPETQSIKYFSKGMKTKMGIAVTLSHHPKLLLLDEVTGGLDPLMRDTVLTIIKEYVKTTSSIAIMSTHLLDDIIKIADKVIFLHKGSMLLKKDVSDISNTNELEAELKNIIARR